MGASERTRVLVVGADPSGKGWGARAHLPGVRAQPTLEPRWYSDYEEAVRDPAVDLVTIAVRVELHEQIACAAVEAGSPCIASGH